MDRNLALEVVRVTEAAALASARFVGLGDHDGADQAATQAMRETFGSLRIRGTVVIGEGERDEAPMLYIGEELGDGGADSPAVDIAVDPLEGTNLCANGAPGALAVVAMAEHGRFLNAPDTYMEKIAVGPGIGAGVVDIRRSPSDNLAAIARKNDGDVGGAIATSDPDAGIDVLLGTGGAPEGVLAAAALRCMNGYMQGILRPRNDAEVARAHLMGIPDLEHVFEIGELAAG